MEAGPQTPTGNGAQAIRELSAGAFDLAAGAICIAHAVAEKEGNKDRHHKMDMAVSDAVTELKRARPDRGIPPEAGPEVLEALLLEDKERFPEELGTRAVIEWCAANPFAPSSLKFKDDKVYDAVYQPARAIGVPDARTDSVRETIKDARSAQSHVRSDKGRLLGVGAGPLAVAGGAPETDDSILARKGVLLAALMALAGGPAELGGTGVSAGMWLLSPLSDTADAREFVRAVLERFDPATLQWEVIKAQAAFKEINLGRPGRSGFSEAIEAMVAKRDGVAAELEARKLRNEDDSDAVEQCEYVLRSINDGLKWMLKQVAD